MRVALGQFNELTHERLTFAKQLGVSGVQMNTPLLPDDQGYWDYQDLKRLKERCDSYGLTLEALENVPRTFYDKAMLGLPGRDEQIENYQRTILNMAKAGIPVLGYHWMPNGVWRTPNTVGRGGVQVTAFDLSAVDSATLVAGLRTLPELEGLELSHETTWENYRYFMDAVVPVAEEVGLKLALHPDDPPIEMLGSVARLFYNREGFKKALEDIAPSPCHGMDFCLGCFSQSTTARGGGLSTTLPEGVAISSPYMESAHSPTRGGGLQNLSEMGKDVLDALRYFGSQGKIFYVHLRDVQGCVPKFQECFLGEGNFNVIDVLKVLKEISFAGFIIDDHVPHFIDDSHWNHRGHAHATGYILGAVEAVKQLYTVSALK